MANIAEVPSFFPERVVIAQAFGSSLNKLSDLEHSPSGKENNPLLEQTRGSALQLAFHLSHTPRIVQSDEGVDVIVFDPYPDGAKEVQEIVETTLFRARI